MYKLTWQDVVFAHRAVRGGLYRSEQEIFEAEAQFLNSRLAPTLPVSATRDNDIIDWLAANVPDYGTEDWCSCFQQVGHRPIICSRHLRIAREVMKAKRRVPPCPHPECAKRDYCLGHEAPDGKIIADVHERMLKALKSKVTRQEAIAHMLAGYDDATWSKLREGRKRTYRRAAHMLMCQWPEFVKLFEVKS